MEVIGLLSLICDLVVQFARALCVSTFPAQSIFKELNQAVDQPLLPAYDVEAALVAVLLQNFTYAAL
jgi:hypothetical protein